MKCVSKPFFVMNMFLGANAPLGIARSVSKEVEIVMIAQSLKEIVRYQEISRGISR